MPKIIQVDSLTRVSPHSTAVGRAEPSQATVAVPHRRRPLRRLLVVSRLTIDLVVLVVGLGVFVHLAIAGSRSGKTSPASQPMPPSTAQAVAGEASASAASQPSTAGAEKTVMATVKSDVRLRSSAGMGNNVVGQLRAGAVVDVLSTSNPAWFQVSYTDSRGRQITGYVSSDYLTIKPR